MYKKINKNIKDNRNIPLEKEIKSYDMLDYEKINIFLNIQKIKSFYGIAKIFDKEVMKKEIMNSNIFFNYAVKLIFQDCIIPIIKKDNLNFIVSIDNRNIKVGELKNLESYLKTEFCLNNFNFDVKYYDSKTKFEIQLADLIVNTFYNKFKDIKIVENVLNNLKKSKFKVNIFPNNKEIRKKFKIKLTC